MDVQCHDCILSHQREKKIKTLPFSPSCQNIYLPEQTNSGLPFATPRPFTPKQKRSKSKSGNNLTAQQHHFPSNATARCVGGKSRPATHLWVVIYYEAASRCTMGSPHIVWRQKHVFLPFYVIFMSFVIRFRYFVFQTQVFKT